MTPTRRASITALTSSLGLLCIAIAVMIPLLQGGFNNSPAFKYTFTIGAAICLVSALFNPCLSKDIKDRRWHRIEAWSAIFFAAAAVFLFIPDASVRDCLAFTLAGAALRIICFFRSVRASKKK